MFASRIAHRRSWLVAGGVALLGLNSCSGTAFTSDGSTSGASANSGSAGKHSGGNASGGASGSDSAGDSGAGAPDAGGMGGAGTDGCECEAGQYCRAGTYDCFDCAELNRLHFGTPERLATVSDNGPGSRFPRVGASNTDLLYRFEGTGVRYTTDASTSPGGNVRGTVETDSGPLLLSTDVVSVGIMTTGFNFLFDRAEEGDRSLYVGQWSAGLLSFERAPAPYNELKNDYSIAVALNATTDGVARAFWMTDRDSPTSLGTPRLVTALAVPESPVTPVDLALGQADCAASDEDLAPWVTNDGKTLLVSHTRLDSSCKPNGQGKDIYTALLQPTTGEATAAALPMSDVNSPKDDVEPSFSADMCDLYFASNRDGKYALYRAHRR